MARTIEVEDTGYNVVERIADELGLMWSFDDDAFMVPIGVHYQATFSYYDEFYGNEEARSIYTALLNMGPNTVKDLYEYEADAWYADDYLDETETGLQALNNELNEYETFDKDVIVNYRTIPTNQALKELYLMEATGFSFEEWGIQIVAMKDNNYSLLKSHKLYIDERIDNGMYAPPQESIIETMNQFEKLWQLI